jgi:hypothetical protein
VKVWVSGAVVTPAALDLMLALHCSSRCSRSVKRGRTDDNTTRFPAMPRLTAGRAPPISTSSFTTMSTPNASQSYLGTVPSQAVLIQASSPAVIRIITCDTTDGCYSVATRRRGWWGPPRADGRTVSGGLDEFGVESHSETWRCSIRMTVDGCQGS